MKLTRPAIVAAALAACSLALAGPAEAHDRRGRGNDAAVAIGAGILGLAIGAAIASDDGDRDVYVRYDDRGYYPPRYRRPYYYPAYPAYRTYPAYPAWRGYEPRYEQWRRWREHERWEHEGGWRGW